MPAPEPRPYSPPLFVLNNAADEAITWFDPRALIHGGRIERRRQCPQDGWYVIRDGHSTGPFPTQAAAKRWAGR